MADMNKVLMQSGPRFGADPELFLARKGKVIGGEKVIPEKGLKIGGEYSQSKVILDGVQIEFNVNPTTCRANFGNDIATVFKTLKGHLKSQPDVKPSFEGVVRVDRREMAKLSEKARQLGCAPSFNTHDPEATIKITSKNKNIRSAGGHIHFGIPKQQVITKEQIKQFVDLCDVVMGNTCVMIDRDPLAKVRRKQYGRAGEYRLPNHGLEYRTLSNFWLRAYPLVSLVLGLGRLAHSIHQNSFYSKMEGYKRSYTWDPAEELLSKVNMKKVVKAINTNDLDLAKENWQVLKTFIKTHIPSQLGTDWRDATSDNLWSLDESSVDIFEYFLKKIEEKGIEYWFPKDPMTHWTRDFSEGHGRGWEAFLLKWTVKPDYDKAQKEAISSAREILGPRFRT